MKKSFQIKGIKQVTENINKVVKEKEKAMTNKGFIQVAILIRQAMENSYPLIPLDTGNLRASWFTVIKGRGEVNTGKMQMVKPKLVSPGTLQRQRSVVSYFKGVVQSSKYPAMIFGFSANYAAAVHEMEGNVNWSKAGSGPKFLEKHLKANKKEIIEILAKEGKDKGKNKGTKR